MNEKNDGSTYEVQSGQLAIVTLLNKGMHSSFKNHCSKVLQPFRKVHYLFSQLPLLFFQNVFFSSSVLSRPLSRPLSLKALKALKAYPLTPWDPEGLPLDPWDRESESRINSRTFLGQFILVFYCELWIGDHNKK